MDAPKLELTLEELYQIVGELEVARRKLQQAVTKLQQDAGAQRTLEFPAKASNE